MLPPVPVLKTAYDTTRCGGGDPRVIGSPLVTRPESLGRLYLADMWGISHAQPLSAGLQDTDSGREKAEGFLASAFSKYKPKLKQAVVATHTKVICERGAFGARHKPSCLTYVIWVNLSYSGNSITYSGPVTQQGSLVSDPEDWAVLASPHLE